jgi:aromatic ring hydroxylase-like protein
LVRNLPTPFEDVNSIEVRDSPREHGWTRPGFNFEWTLLAFGADPPDTAAFEAIAKAMSFDLEVVRHTEPRLLELYEAPLVLIRPDQFVAWRGRDTAAPLGVLAAVSGIRP